ncbi:MAG: hypothetical protein ACI837_001091 [Crocinitomicaceae bacterium]|jgi:hypothetical protein
MHYLITVLLLSSIGNVALANSSTAIHKSWLVPIPYTKVSAKLDVNLPEERSLFEFDFALAEIIDSSFVMQYSVDGNNLEVFIEREEKLKILVTPGLHIFEFYVKGYIEIRTDSILIDPQYRDTYVLNFQQVPDPVLFLQPMLMDTVSPPAMVWKPVIYLYPEEETNVEVTMNIKGKDAFLYPAYDENWKFTAHPNGDLVFGDNTYNYLFWEANATNSIQLDRNQDGFLVKREEVVSFLENKLTEANLTSKEKADFITFWGPKMTQNDLNFVHFVFNESCEQYADIAIDPVPKSVYRIYILFAPASESFNVNPQKMIAANRDGFHVIEWGGQQQTLPPFSAQLMH